MMALEYGLIGISMTNSPPLIVPTFGRDAMLGSNPIAIAVPAGKSESWVLDMATSIVPISKIGLYSREGEQLLVGWATDENGVSTTDSSKVYQNLTGQNILGGLFPLGGEGELFGGHKGYGLAMMVDILSGVLSGANFGPDAKFFNKRKIQCPNIGHFFLVFDPSFFIDTNEFTARMDSLMERLQTSDKAEGHNRIYVHGEKEADEYRRRIKNGIPLDETTVSNLISYSEKFGVELD
jgi:LDH2 family malate/lactate/ureidoglycolate dehydrogenase